jgi:hypothetical protein
LIQQATWIKLLSMQVISAYRSLGNVAGKTLKKSWMELSSQPAT